MNTRDKVQKGTQFLVVELSKDFLNPLDNIGWETLALFIGSKLASVLKIDLWSSWDGQFKFATTQVSEAIFREDGLEAFEEGLDRFFVSLFLFALHSFLIKSFLPSVISISNPSSWGSWAILSSKFQYQKWRLHTGLPHYCQTSSEGFSRDLHQSLLPVICFRISINRSSFMGWQSLLKRSLRKRGNLARIRPANSK